MSKPNASYETIMVISTKNGEDATTGADAVVLHDGDHYGWFYTAG